MYELSTTHSLMNVLNFLAASSSVALLGLDSSETRFCAAK